MIDGTYDGMDNTDVFDIDAVTRRAARTLASGKKDPYGDAEGEVRRPEQLSKYTHASTVILCKDIADILTKQYPDYAWAVQPDERGQVINIFNLHCHNSLGYTIRFDDIMHDMRRKQAYRAGGEILERFRLSRKMDREELKSAPRDAHGMLIPTLDDQAASRLKDNAEYALKLATGDWEIVDTPRGKYLRKNQ